MIANQPQPNCQALMRLRFARALNHGYPFAWMATSIAMRAMESDSPRPRTQKITGRIDRFLTNSAAEVNGIVLEDGRSFAFPAARAKDVLEMAGVGSYVELQAIVPEGWPANRQLDLAAMTEPLSGKQFCLSELPTSEPEVRAETYPPPGAATPPLAPTTGIRAHERDKRARAAIPPVATEAIEQAYDRLHHTQVMFAFLKKPSWAKSEVFQYLQEAKRTYVQALGRYQARDFEGACECAAASRDLSCMIEILIAKALDTTSSHVQAELVAECRESEEAIEETVIRDNLKHTDTMLGRVHWVATNGTLPTEDREQAIKLAVWGEQLKSWARRLLDIGAQQEANQFAHAAHAAAGAAEHVCRKCYVSRYGETAASAAARTA